MGNACFKVGRRQCGVQNTPVMQKAEPSTASQGFPTRIGEQKLTVEGAQQLMSTSGRFEIKGVAGYGSYEDVYSADDKSNSGMVAIKFIAATLHMLKCLKKTIVSHRKLCHPNIVEFKRFMVLPGVVCIALEYTALGTLQNYLQRQVKLKESLARHIFQQLVLAVEYCHRKGILIQDISLENILLSGDEMCPTVKLCGFGYSSMDARAARLGARLGNMDYVPPEALSPGNNAYDKRSCDIWACGIVLYMMLEGKHPFQANIPEFPGQNGMHEVLKKVQECDYPPLSNASDECKMLVEKMLCPMSNRIAITDVMTNLWCATDSPDSYLHLNNRIRSNDGQAMANVEKIQSADQITRYLVSCSFGGLDDELNAMIDQVVVENNNQ